MLPIGTQEAGELSRDRGNGYLALAKALGIGGSLWTITTTTGGDYSPATPVTSDPFEAYICLGRDVQPIGSPSGTTISDDSWLLVAPDSPPISTGGRVSSIDDPVLEFIVGAISERPYNVVIAHVELVVHK